MPARPIARPGSILRVRRLLLALAVAGLGGLAGLAGAVGGCAPAPGTPGEPPAPGAGGTGYVKTVRPEEVDLWRGVHYPGLLLDVRSPDEWNDWPGLLEGATRIPLAELEARLPELAAYRSRPTLVFDATGPRGQAGAQVLAREGFVDVGWVEGGIEAYRRVLEGQR